MTLACNDIDKVVVRITVNYWWAIMETFQTEVITYTMHWSCLLTVRLHYWSPWGGGLSSEGNSNGVHNSLL